MIHQIKIQRKWHERILSGEKMFEVRHNDRDYQAGDKINFQVLNEENPSLEHTDALYEITYVHSGLGMRDNYVVLGIKPEGER